MRSCTQAQPQTQSASCFSSTTGAHSTPTGAFERKDFPGRGQTVQRADGLGKLVFIVLMTFCRSAKFSIYYSKSEAVTVNVWP